MNKNAKLLPALEVNDLTVAFDDKPVLWDIDLEVPPGVLMAIVGPNGAGKSTLKRTILGLKKPAAGSALIFGKEVKKQSKLIGYVPQRSTVDWDFPTSVGDTVLMGAYGQMGWVRRPQLRHKRMAMEALEKVGISDLAGPQISEFSGGQQQRVFLARALIQNAGIYFIDEPFQGVDATTEIAIVEVLRSLQREGKTVVVVHHDLQTVNEYFDWLTLLNQHKIASGPMDQTLTDANLKRAYGVPATVGI